MSIDTQSCWLSHPSQFSPSVFSSPFSSTIPGVFAREGGARASHSFIVVVSMSDKRPTHNGAVRGQAASLGDSELISAMSGQIHQHFVALCASELTIDRLRAGYLPSGHRSPRTSVGGRPGDVGGPDIVIGDESDSTGSHQSATAAALSAAAAVRKSCLGSSHASSPWRPQGKFLSRSAAATVADVVFLPRRINAI